MSEPRCQRCGCAAQGGPTNKPDARMLRRATNGVCVNCAVVLFLQRLANMHGEDSASGRLMGHPVEVALRLPHVQEQFSQVMRAANAEATPDEIDWEVVIAKWNVGPAEKGLLF